MNGMLSGTASNFQNRLSFAEHLPQNLKDRSFIAFTGFRKRKLQINLENELAQNFRDGVFEDFDDLIEL